MSDPSTPGGPLEGPDPDERETLVNHPDRAGTSPPNTAWSAPDGGWEQPGPANVGWAPPSPQAGWTRLPDSGWSPPARQEATWIAPLPPDAGSQPLHASQPGSPRRRHRFARVAVGILLVATGSLLGVAVSHGFWQSHTATAVQTHRAGGASSIASRVAPVLVDINLTLGYQSGEGAATGIVLTPSGLVLTNNHVIDGATAIRATDIGNGRTYSATVVGYDRSRDIALIQLNGASGLATAQLGDSAKVTVGQKVIAIGNAGGVGGTPSEARGAVVALRQQITASDALDGTS
jgi:hypothetical protein